jgi:hypothetical protein
MSRRIRVRKQRKELQIDRLAHALLQAARAATEPQQLWETKHGPPGNGTTESGSN